MIEYDAKRWIHLALHVRGSVVPRVAGRVLVAAAAGAAVAFADRNHGAHVAPLLHTLVGVALSLLLVFRTNAAYDRWWEGRKLLGMMVNRARDLTRQATVWIDDAAERARVRRWVVAYLALAMQGLRRERDLAAVAEWLTAEERAALEPRSHRANVVANWIAAVVRVQAGSEQRIVAMDANLTSFNDSVGGAERIMKTPLPLAYAQHTKLLVALFVFTAPFAVVDSMGWLTPVAEACIAFALFGVDEIGVEIEDPFGYDPNDLPLEAILGTIAADTREIEAAPLPGATLSGRGGAA
jgi:putative membrane protein